MQELKAMWPHHKAVITMRTHEATWPHHMPIFLKKAQGLLKNKSELFSVLHAPIYKVISSSIFKIFEILKFVKCTMPIYKFNKMNFQHTQETLTNITVMVPFGQELVQMLYTT